VIFASPYKRTQQTAQVIVSELHRTEDKKCEIKTRIELAETHTMQHNNWKNLKIPPALKELLADSGIHQPEPDSHVEARCLSLIKELGEANHLSDVLLVSHAGLILEFVSLLCAPNKAPPMRVSYCDVYCFERNDELRTWQLIKL
jgi:broad specificity phosphatase PhoE